MFTLTRRLAPLVLFGTLAVRLHPGVVAAPPESAAGSVRVTAMPGVSPARRATVLGDLLEIRRAVDGDFMVRSGPQLRVVLYPTTSSFGRALHHQQGIWPQSSLDTTGNVVAGTLLLGPPTTVFRHNLVHIYTEWVLDGLTRNAADRQPDPAWLYDGMAEWEADRRGPALPCSVPGSYPIPLHRLASPRRWWRLRAGIEGGMEYCEARVAAGKLVNTVGLPAIVALLQHHPTWAQFAQRLQSQAEMVTRNGMR